MSNVLFVVQKGNDVECGRKGSLEVRINVIGWSAVTEQVSEGEGR